MRKTCSVEGCGLPHEARGMCVLHYSRWRRTADGMRRLPILIRPPCTVEGCDQPRAGRGLCAKHLHRWQKYGTTSSPTPPTPADRFWRRVDRGGPVHPTLGPCWLWTGPGRRDGYAGMCVDGRLVLAHRFSWTLHHGPVPPGLYVCHLCDDAYEPGDFGYRRCTNPAHLFLGTNDDNMADRNRKGRQARGERNGSARLTAAQVVDIRRRYRHHSRTQGSTALAREFGVHSATILAVVKGVWWKHV
jgi:hypothetical protein